MLSKAPCMRVFPPYLTPVQFGVCVVRVLLTVWGPSSSATLWEHEVFVGTKRNPHNGIQYILQCVHICVCVCMYINVVWDRIYLAILAVQPINQPPNLINIYN